MATPTSPFSNAAVGLSTLFLAFGASTAIAQPGPGGGIVGVLEDNKAPSLHIPSSVTRSVRRNVADGVLSLDDFTAAMGEAGARINPREMAELQAALSGKLPSGETFTVAEGVRGKAVELIYLANLFDNTKQALASGKTLAGTPIPQAVKELVAKAKLNGAVAYDVTDTNSDGEGRYTDYPAVTPATENMAFSWTEITPAALAADIALVTTSLKVSGSRTLANGAKVANYTRMFGGTGSISAAYDEVSHPTRGGSQFGWRTTLASLGYPAWIAEEFKVDDLRKARSSSGNRWSSNCAILSDGTIHCLPAIRRHSRNRGLILTNPALSRGHQLLWNGHLTARNGVITSVGTSGRISSRAARGRDRFINPVPLLKAWGFKVAPNVVVKSEHATRRFKVDEENAVIYGSRD